MFNSNDNEQNLEDFLKENYHEIYESINREGFIIEYPTFHTIREIEYDNKIVGFISLEAFSFVPTDFSVNECYIMPEYRGKNLFFNELLDLMITINTNIVIRNPNKALIKVLIKNGFASKISDNLVVSYVEFLVMIDTLYKNPKIKQFYKKSETDYIPYRANLYDMDFCSVMFLDPALEYVKYSDVFALTLPRKNDLKKYKLRKKLKKVNESYLDKCYDTFQEKKDEISQYLDDVESDYYELISVESLFGTCEKLTDDFKELLESRNLTENDGFRIIEHINNALDEGNLIPESARFRMAYLVDNFEAIENELDTNSDDCPFCGSFNFDFLENCESCGQKIRDESFTEEFLKKLENFDLEAMLDDLKDEINFDEVLGRVPIESDDPLFELKTFYNEFLTGFDFEEIKQYYLNRPGVSIEDILTDYFDSKILNEKDEKAKFNFFTDYLCAAYYYHLDNGQFDEALSYIIQLAILASNCDDEGEGNIIERKPRAIDISYEMEQFLKNDPKFDLDNSYKLAIENFKVDYWLNNEKEVFDAISELLNN